MGTFVLVIVATIEKMYSSTSNWAEAFGEPPMSIPKVRKEGYKYGVDG